MRVLTCMFLTIACTSIYVIVCAIMYALIALFWVLSFISSALREYARQQRVAARDRQNYEYWLEVVTKIRAFDAQQQAFALSLTPSETLFLQAFLLRHPTYKAISYRRRISFVPQFSIAITDDDFMSRRNLKTRQKEPSIAECITDALASFKDELCLLRMRTEFVKKHFYNVLPCHDCCDAVVQRLAL